MEPTEITMTYQDVSGYDFVQAMQKIGSTPTVAAKAAHIRRVTKEIENARKRIIAEYETDIMMKYGEKNEDGTLKRPEDEPHGFVPADATLEELKKAQAEFSTREIKLTVMPFNSNTLSDMKISAKDIDALKGLFSEEFVSGGPGLPSHLPNVQASNVQSIRPQ